MRGESSGACPRAQPGPPSSAHRRAAPASDTLRYKVLCDSLVVFRSTPLDPPHSETLMVRHILALIFIFIATTVAWAILGSTLLLRTYQSDSTLRGRVQSTWGAPQEQSPPTATWRENVTNNVESVVNGKTVRRAVMHTNEGTLPLEKSRIRVAIALTHRLKGLRWFSTYKVDFRGAYSFRNPTGRDQRVTYALQFP